MWCDLEFFPNSRGNKAAANLRPKVEYTAVLLSCGACVLRYSRFRVLRVTVLCDRDHIVTGTVTSGRPGQARAESLTRNELTPPRQSLGLGLGGSSGSRPAAPPAAAEDRSGMITQIQLPLISSKFAQSDSDLLARECARIPAQASAAGRGPAVADPVPRPSQELWCAATKPGNGLMNKFRKDKTHNAHISSFDFLCRDRPNGNDFRFTSAYGV